MFLYPLLLFPATPGWGVWCVFVCSGSGFGCAPPLLAGLLESVCVCVPAPVVPCHSWLGCVVWLCVLGLGFLLRPAIPGWGVGVCVCVCVCPLRLYPATPGWGGRCGCGCLCSGFGCAPPLLAGVLGCVSVCVRAPPVPRHSWPGCVVWVCVLGLGFRPRPATPGWGVGVCVCLCARSACTPPLLAGVCGVGVWVGCCLAPVPVLWFVACCARCPVLRHPVAVVAWHLFMCHCFGRQRASLACLVAPRWCAALRPVRSLSVPQSAFLMQSCLSASRGVAPPVLLGGCAGHVEAGRELGSLCLPLAPAALWARSALYPFEAPQGGRPWRVPPASVLGCVRCGGWRVWTRSLTRPVSRTACLSTGDSAGALGLFRVDADTSPCGSEDATPRSRACVRARALLGRVGRAGLPGAFWCATPFPVASLSLFSVRPPPGLGRPVYCVFLFFSICAPPLSLAFRGFRPGVPWALASCSPPSPLYPSFFLSFRFFPTPPLPPVFFFLHLGVLFPAVFFVFFCFCSGFFFSLFCRLCDVVSLFVFVAVGSAGV